jgi:lysophospholipase
MEDPAALLQRVAAGLRPLEVTLAGPAILADAPLTEPGNVPTGGEAALTADERDYLAFYSLDFSLRYPDLRHSLGFVTSRDQRLAVHVLQQSVPRGVLLVVHGYLDHVGLYRHLIAYGLERGYSVVAFDLPGHGLSSGDRVSIDDFSDYRVAIEDVVGACRPLSGPWRVIAQSTGAAAVLDLLLQRGGEVVEPVPIEKVVMLAPLVRPRGWFWVSPSQRVIHRFKDSVRRNFAENSGDPAFLKWIRTDPLQSDVLSTRWIGALRRWIKALPEAASRCSIPLLIIQGDADRTVDWRYNVSRVRQFFSGSRVEYLPGARHHLANESQPVRAHINVLMDEFFGGSTV